jgi:hypothetical protein
MSVSLLRAGPECIADSPDETVTHPMRDIFKQTMKIDIDTRFPTKLDVITDAPEPLRGALLESLPSEQPVRLLIHAPAFSTVDQQTPATVLAVTNDGWLIASETEDGGASVEKSDFSGTLFLELTSILLYGQFRLYFATVGTAYSAAVKFDTVGEEFYREAIDLILKRMDQTRTPAVQNDRILASAFETWPMKFRTETERYQPKGQRLSAAIHWPAIFDGFQREIAPAGALLVTERELVLISEEKQSPRRHAGDIHGFGGVITYFPLARLADFHVSHHERFGVLALEVHAAHGGKKLEIIFPSDEEKTVSKAMEQTVRPSLLAAK